VDVSKQAIREAPEFDPVGQLDRPYEAHYHAHFGRPGYWERRPEAWRLFRHAA
jgi:hypothetical protein